jgi:transposase-like protein
MSRRLVCGPYVCRFPHPGDHRRWSRWTCPACGTTYVRTRKLPERWWRTTVAPDGYWRLPYLRRSTP